MMPVTFRFFAGFCLVPAFLTPAASEAVTVVAPSVYTDGISNPANGTQSGTGSIILGSGTVGMTWSSNQSGLLGAPTALYDFGLQWGAGANAIMSPFVGDNTTARTPNFSYTYKFDQALNGLQLTDLGHWMSEYGTWTFSWTASSSTGTWTNGNSFTWTDAYLGSSATKVANGNFTSGTAIRFDYDGTQGNNGLNNYNFSDWSLALPDGVTSVTVDVAFNVPGSAFIGAGPDVGVFTYRGHIGYDEVALNFDNALVGAVPEPQTYAMLLAGLMAVGGLARRRSGRLHG